MKNERSAFEGMDDHRHQMRCPECGSLFDMRDLMAVLEHQHRDAPVPQIRYSKAAPVPVPLRFPRRRSDPN
ncbi:MAG: hypothetical protein EOO15_11050 [Chitinophagaceae bacterium]|nr:MAG: hypothetical protein EOO15_11050 [Chitinophagaceae bacterium]